MSTGNSVSATGRLRHRDGRPYLEFERRFRAPIDHVWDAVTDPVRLERWIGTWTGDPADGSVEFRMTAEGDDCPAETVWIQSCRPPVRLVLRTSTPDDPTTEWRWELELSEADDGTILTFRQEVTGHELAQGVGPGWDYYLDRLLTAETGGDPSTIDFDDYHPALTEHYRAELAGSGA